MSKYWNIFALLAFLCHASSSFALSEPLTPDGKSVEVKIGVYVNKIFDINVITQSFMIDCYIYTRWQDPRQAFTPAEGEPAVKVLTNKSAEKALSDTVWFPALEFMNAIQKPSSENLKLTIRANGNVSLDERLVVKLSTNFELKKFPFDQQTLPILLESFTSNADKVTLVADNEASVVDAYAKLLEWDIIGQQAKIKPHHYNYTSENDEFSRYYFLINIERKAGYYLWKIILPLSLIIIIACFLFWTSLHTDKFATVGFTLMLTVVAFNFSVSTLLPKASYITLMDAVVIMSYMVIFIFILTMLLFYALNGSGEKRRMVNFMRFMSFGLPSFYVISMIFIGYIFLSAP